MVDFIQKNGTIKILDLQWKIVFGENGKKKVTTYIIAKDVTEEETKRRKKNEEDEREKLEVRRKLFSITEDLKSIEPKGKV